MSLAHVSSADRVDIVVHDLGGHGRPAILAHANGFHAMVFSALAGELVEDLHCWAPDLRGHGLSGAPADLDFGWGRYGDDVLATAELVARLGKDSGRPIGIGHSLGGAALMLAESRRPGTFAGLYCYEPILFPASERPPIGSDDRLARGARSRRDDFSSFEEALEHYRERPFFAQLAPGVLESYVMHGIEPTGSGAFRLRCRPEHEARTFEAAVQSRVAEHLAQVRCPVLIAVGERSHDIGRSGALAAAADLPDARALEFAGLGHLGPLEAPDVVAASIRKFLGELE